jgi:hypothetical protein
VKFSENLIKVLVKLPSPNKYSLTVYIFCINLLATECLFSSSEKISCCQEMANPYTLIAYLLN